MHSPGCTAAHESLEHEGAPAATFARRAVAGQARGEGTREGAGACDCRQAVRSQRTVYGRRYRGAPDVRPRPGPQGHRHAGRDPVRRQRATPGACQDVTVRAEIYGQPRPAGPRPLEVVEPERDVMTADE